MSPVRRRLTAVTIAAAATLAVSACGTSFNAQTNQVYQAGVGANHRGDVDVLNTLLVANADGSATLSASILNGTDAEQELASVSVVDAEGQELPVESTEILLPLPDGVLVPVGAQGDAGGFFVTEGAGPGDYVTVTLTFSDATPVTIQAPVVDRTEMYATVSTGLTDDGTAGVEVSPTETQESGAPSDEPAEELAAH